MAEDKTAALPQPFVERMETMLQGEQEDFLAAYAKERWYGLRFNALKMDKETFLKRMPFTLEPVQWAEEGFYYKPEQQPGKHLFHEIGAYYIQEPSAMAVAEVLAPAPGERVLDLCAAPGGKSTQIAGKMRGEGLLVSNEIVPGRAKILSQNIERMGIVNAVVCNETPERLAERFPSFFDKILVDAPCSGEGMFRKDETAIKEWSPEQVKLCAERQRTILEQAVLMLKPGGTLVYSTCTFSVEENEGVIGEFLKEHPEFSIEKAAQEKYFAPGRDDWAAELTEGEAHTSEADDVAGGIRHTMRLWPHKLAGEGHFIAKLRKMGTLESDRDYVNLSANENERIAEKGSKRKGSGQRKEKTSMDDIGLCRAFLQKELKLSDAAYAQLEEKGIFFPFGEQIYLVPRQMISLKGLKVIRPGLHLGTNKKNRFEPSHALALYLSADMVKRHYEMTTEQAESYLRGEAFACDETAAGRYVCNGTAAGRYACNEAAAGREPKGWTLLTIGGYTAGFGKAGNGLMKNHYPKGLRKERTISCQNG